MAFNIIDFLGNISNVLSGKDNENANTEVKKAVNDYMNANKQQSNAYNPFLKKDGQLFNPGLNYQGLLNSESLSNVAKKYITQATGLKPYNTSTQVNSSQTTSVTNPTSSDITFNPDADINNLASLDIKNELPKLNTSQIESIISKHFSKSTVIKPTDAEGIFNAQQETGMSALAILGIGALESGYGTSNIAKKKNNIWGWNATNVNPSGNATTFSAMSQGALEYAQKFMNTYYNKYGATTIHSAGTGENPSGKGYAYNDDGSINSKWARDVGSIMGKFYSTAKSTSN